MPVYEHLQFPTLPHRPYFFSNFVISIDGRAVIKDTKDYEPLGSSIDFETFLDLRKYADALIHGKHTAVLHRTLDTRAQKESLEKRREQKKPEILPYFIVTNHPDVSLLAAVINNPLSEKPYIVTTEKAIIPVEIQKETNVLRFGNEKVDLTEFSTYLFEKDMKQVLVEGGPTLLGSFFANDLIDEIFLTIAPKVINGNQNDFFTMNQGGLVSPEKLTTWKLLSVSNIESELFLRYQKPH
jgi:riboflavin biosynthesis pyrimidine reductase